MTMRSATAPREFTGKHMLASIIAFFGVIIAVNLTMAYFANSTWSGLVVANGYVASQHFDEDLARARAQEAMGWSVSVGHDGSAVNVTFADRTGEPLSGMTVNGMLRRPTTDRQDQPLAFASVGNGRYEAPIKLHKGVWDVEVTATGRSGEDYRKTYRFIVKE
jgi:nitrogen fixation protein FixH